MQSLHALVGRSKHEEFLRASIAHAVLADRYALEAYGQFCWEMVSENIETVRAFTITPSTEELQCTSL